MGKSRAEEEERAGAKREKGVAFVIKTEQSKYSDALRTRQSDAELGDSEGDVRSIIRTRTGELFLEFKRDEERMGTAYKMWVKEVLGEGLDVKSLTAETTLKVKTLDEITDTAELVMAQRKQ